MDSIELLLDIPWTKYKAYQNMTFKSKSQMNYKTGPNWNSIEDILSSVGSAIDVLENWFWRKHFFLTYSDS